MTKFEFELRDSKPHCVENAGDTELTQKPICPHCGDVEQNSWEIDFGGLEGDVILTCGECGLEYTCSRSASIYYTTKPLSRCAKGEQR